MNFNAKFQTFMKFVHSKVIGVKTCWFYAGPKEAQVQTWVAVAFDRDHDLLLFRDLQNPYPITHLCD